MESGSEEGEDDLEINEGMKKSLGWRERTEG